MGEVIMLAYSSERIPSITTGTMVLDKEVMETAGINLPITSYFHHEMEKTIGWVGLQSPKSHSQ